MPTVVLSPFSVINFSEGGGHFWVYMQYAQGLLGSGCDVYWLEAFRSRGSRGLDELMLAPFRARMEQFGLGDKLILYPSDDAKIADGNCQPASATASRYRSRIHGRSRASKRSRNVERS